MSGLSRRARVEAFTPPAWKWARRAMSLKRERGVSLRAYRRARGARLDLLPQFVDLEAGLIVDLGANRGDWTADVLAALPASRILAVEPFPPAHARVVHRFGGAPNVRVDDRAVSSITGSATFNVAARDVFGSLLAAEPALEAFYGADAQMTHAITVATVTLDQLVAGEPVSLLKVDVQGAELQVFEGGANTLATTQAVLVEANFARHYRGGARFSEVDDALTASGFALWHLTPALRAEDERMLWADAVYARPPLTVPSQASS